MNYTINATIKVVGARDGLESKHVIERLQDVYPFWGGDVDEVDAEVFPSQVNFRVVKIDETRSWRDDFQEYGPIYGVYFYDPNEVTYACELTPSYTLYPLYDYAEREMPDDLTEEMMTGGTGEPVYVHCHQIPRTLHEESFEYEEDDTYQSLILRAQEYWMANWPV